MVIVVTTIMTGVVCAMLRSTIAVIFVAFLVVAAFGVAAFFSPVNFLDLGLALLGYNLGLAGLVGGYFIFAADPAV